MEVLIRRGAAYLPTWDWQRGRAAAVGDGRADEALLVVEHDPVYTLGQRSDPAHLLQDEGQLRAAGAEVVWVDRGGDVTWHGPGQITGYPILDLKRRGRDLHHYVATIEQLLIDVCAVYGVTARRESGMPGVWVGARKIAAIGVRFTKCWTTYHGFALNVANDPAWFERIVPCGLHGYSVTSLSELLGRPVRWDDVAHDVVEHFSRLFGVDTFVQSAHGAPDAAGRGADHVGRL